MLNAGGFRYHIEKKLYKEADRGAVFGQKLMDTLAGINTGVEMPVIDRHDEVWQYYLSQMLPSREAEYGIHNIEDGGVALSKMGELLHGRLNSAAERLLAVIEQCS